MRTADNPLLTHRCLPATSNRFWWPEMTSVLDVVKTTGLLIQTDTSSLCSPRRGAPHHGSYLSNRLTPGKGYRKLPWEAHGFGSYAMLQPSFSPGVYQGRQDWLGVEHRRPSPSGERDPLCCQHALLSLHWCRRSMHAVLCTAFWYQNSFKRFVILCHSSPMLSYY